MTKLIDMSAFEMRAGLLRGDFTAVELTQAHLDRISDTNPKFNSFIAVVESQALSDAARADKIIKERKDSAPSLTGIPIAIKDNLVTKGIETTAASKILKNFIPPYDCTVVSRLKENNAVILGKTNLDEFAMGSSNEHSTFGPVKNPWDVTRVPGGSSGGSAVAVATGQAPFSLGSDTGGSIRQPASLTGIVGIKPTYGRVSRYGLIAFASSLDQVGSFARSPRDLAMMLQTISGHDPMDSTSMTTPVPNFLAEMEKGSQKGLRGLRVGVPAEYFIDGIEPDVLASIKSGLELLKGLGAELVDISLPHTKYATAVYYILAPAEASSNLSRFDGVRYGYRDKSAKTLSDMYELTRAHGFGAEVKRRIMIGTYVLSAGYYDAYYRKAQQVRTLIINDFKAAFHNKCDVIATPVSPTTAFKIGEKMSSPLQMYLADIFTIPANLAGLPGISIPCGLDINKLPVGLQLMAKPFAEAELLSISQAFVDEFGWKGEIRG